MLTRALLPLMLFVCPGCWFPLDGRPAQIGPPPNPEQSQVDPQQTKEHEVNFTWTGYAEVEKGDQKDEVRDSGTAKARTSALFFNQALTQVAFDVDLKFRWGVVQRKIEQGWSLKFGHSSKVTVEAERPLPWEK